MLVVKVPETTVSVPEDVKASPSVVVVDAPCTVTGPRVLPALVIVPVARNVVVPLCVQVMPETAVRLPDTCKAELPVNVPVKPVKFRF